MCWWDVKPYSVNQSTIGWYTINPKICLRSYLSYLFRLRLLSDDSYSLEVLQSADKTKTHPKAKSHNAPTFTGHGSHSHVCLLLVIKIKTCTYRLCRSADTSVLFGWYRLSAEQQIIGQYRLSADCRCITSCRLCLSVSHSIVYISLLSIEFLHFLFFKLLYYLFSYATFLPYEWTDNSEYIPVFCHFPLCKWRVGTSYHIIIISNCHVYYYLRTGWHFVSSSETGGSLQAFLQKYL